MAENIIDNPKMCPIKWVEVDPVDIPQYISKSMDDYVFSEQLAEFPYLEQVPYAQKWQKNDTIKEQNESNYDPIDISLIDENGVAVVTVIAQNLLLNKYQPGMYVYEWTMALVDVTEGCYFLKKECGDPVLKTLISEPQIIKSVHPGTQLYEYRNSRFHGDVVFETGIKFGFRVESAMPPGGLLPGGIRNVYEDEKLNPFVTQAKPFDENTVTIGPPEGVPDWVVQKMNWIWSCNDVRIDGVSFAMSGTDFEYNEEDNYPMRGIKIKVREGINRGSKIVTATSNPNLKLVVGLNVTTALFGDVSGNGSNNVINIMQVE